MRLAILCDYVEEGWPSMDLATEMLHGTLQANHAQEVTATRVCPPMKRRFGRLPFVGGRRSTFNADRLLNRMWDYPRHLRRLVGEFDCFHVGDHSYAQLVHELPAGRTGVYCHDLDAFRCVLDSSADPRPRWFRAMMRRVLRGMQRAAVVFHSTLDVRRQIERFGIVDPARLVHAPYGVSAEFSPHPADPDPAAEVLSPLHGAPYLLHVGSCIPRKRIDVLLDVFAGLRENFPELQLVQIGGEWTPERHKQLARLDLTGVTVQRGGLSRAAVASLYRQARLVLLPSEAEGFGLPMIEALACGAAVLASDIPVLREVGGTACTYCPVGSVSSWVETARGILGGWQAPPLGERLRQAERYSWGAHARTVLAAYQWIVSRTGNGSPSIPRPMA